MVSVSVDGMLKELGVQGEGNVRGFFSIRLVAVLLGCLLLLLAGYTNRETELFIHASFFCSFLSYLFCYTILYVRACVCV